MSYIINLYGGPCTGKSTKAAEIFAELKKNNYNIELNTEIAKDLTWENNIARLDDQLLVMAMQYHKLITVINSKVDYVVTDSPFILSVFYYKETSANLLDKHVFFDFVMNLYRSIENQGHKFINIYLEKNENNYTLTGRKESNIIELENLDHAIRNGLQQMFIRQGKLNDNLYYMKNTDSIDVFMNILQKAKTT